LNAKIQNIIGFLFRGIEEGNVGGEGMRGGKSWINSSWFFFIANL